MPVFVDSGQCFVQVGVKVFVASLNDGQSFGCKSEVTSRGEVGFIGDDVCLVEVEIAEI